MLELMDDKLNQPIKLFLQANNILEGEDPNNCLSIQDMLELITIFETETYDQFADDDVTFNNPKKKRVHQTTMHITGTNRYKKDKKMKLFWDSLYYNVVDMNETIFHKEVKLTTVTKKSSHLMVQRFNKVILRDVVNLFREQRIKKVNTMLRSDQTVFAWLRTTLKEMNISTNPDDTKLSRKLLLRLSSLDEKTD